ncbi:helix-turn-helix transcriptional regulator [Microbacterium halotolerans]|uniref:helix-turn-helix transcriptional regulator n=1 Tax=Microbacterium halotolerans TaxID=246613 RepID=UPI0013C2C8E5|nr:LuxR C-terminal-related transcriptional regulator [Microbacterium halotolerans]
MSTAAAFMLAYRLHGQYRKALHFATITEELTRHACVAQPGRIAIRVPSAILQVGITRLLAGEYHRASLLLREAYELRDETWDGRVGGDAAGKLALLFAIRGHTVEAERWLSRHDHGAGSLGWMVPLVQLSAKVAAVLIAVDRLDQAASETALRELEIQVNRERSWAPFVTYARSRYDLLWGDPRTALNRIDRTRAFTGVYHRTAGIEPRLDAVRADLLLAVGRTSEAQELLAERQDSPHLAPVAARLALLADKKPAAREHIAAGLAADEVDLRSQVDLLITSALAEDSPATGRRHLQQAITAAAQGHSYSSFALARRSSLVDVVNAMDTSDRARAEKFLSMAPEPLPLTIDLVELTATEEKVLALLAAGEPRPRMAQLLFVSENTVKFHVRNLYRKLGADSREDALARAHHLRLLQTTDA